MKLTKFSCLLIFSITVFTCGSDDDSSSDNTPQPVTIVPTITADVDAILALPVDPVNPVDITALVNFGQAAGVSTADYTAELRIGDTFTVAQPVGLQAGDIFVYENAVFEDPAFDAIADQYLSFVDCIDEFGAPDANCDNEDFYLTFSMRAIDALDDDDLDEKYDIFCYIRRGVDEFGPFVIDPKIRIKGRNTLN